MLTLVKTILAARRAPAVALVRWTETRPLPPPLPADDDDLFG